MQERKRQEQQQALERAASAASARDPLGMLQELHSSFLLDGMARHLAAKWPALADDVNLIVGEAVDDFYSAVGKGRKIINPAAYLFKVANNKMYDLSVERKREILLPPEEVMSLAAEDDGDTSYDDASVNEEEHEARRSAAIAAARRLLPRLGQVNIQRVMEYVLDALEAGAVEVPNAEIANALGLSSATVRQSLSRGFRRLSLRAGKEGLIAEGFSVDQFGVSGDV